MRKIRGQALVLWVSVILLILLTPSLAWAHIGVGDTRGFAHGLAHPMFGIDHVCAMIAIGLWAAQRGGRAIWIVPVTFVSTMVLSGALAQAGLRLPLVEPGIAASVLVLGLLVAGAVRLPLVTSAILVGLFAVLHGHSHGTEMPATASGVAYASGFVAATASLHVLGIAFALLLGRFRRSTVVRFAGVAIAVVGGYLLLA